MDQERLEALASTALQGRDALESGDVEEAYEALDSLVETLELMAYDHKVLFIPKGVGGE
jgi:hypothetical protein